MASSLYLACVTSWSCSYRHLSYSNKMPEMSWFLIFKAGLAFFDIKKWMCACMWKSGYLALSLCSLPLWILQSFKKPSEGLPGRGGCIEFPVARPQRQSYHISHALMGSCEYSFPIPSANSRRPSEVSRWPRLGSCHLTSANSLNCQLNSRLHLGYLQDCTTCRNIVALASGARLPLPTHRLNGMWFLSTGREGR
jgi:hypothetical protein